MDNVLVIILVLIALLVGLVLGFLFGDVKNGNIRNEENKQSCPIIDLQRLASVPGIKIKGPGIDIDTSEMNAGKGDK